VSITSASTTAQIEAQVLDNLSYQRENSVATAHLFLEACTALLFRRPSQSEHSGSRLAWSMEFIHQQIQQAQAWLASQAGSSGAADNVAHPSFENFRG
jgi:hypothetical protein